MARDSHVPSSTTGEPYLSFRATHTTNIEQGAVQMATGTHGFGEGFLSATGARGVANLVDNEGVSAFLTEVAEALDNFLSVEATATAEQRICGPVRDAPRDAGRLGGGDGGSGEQQQAPQEEQTPVIRAPDGLHVVETADGPFHVCCHFDTQSVRGKGDKTIEFKTSTWNGSCRAERSSRSPWALRRPMRPRPRAH